MLFIQWNNQVVAVAGIAGIDGRFRIVAVKDGGIVARIQVQPGAREGICGAAIIRRPFLEDKKSRVRHGRLGGKSLGRRRRQCRWNIIIQDRPARAVPRPRRRAVLSDPRRGYSHCLFPPCSWQASDRRNRPLKRPLRPRLKLSDICVSSLLHAIFSEDARF